MIAFAMPNRLTGRHVLFILLSFFGTVFAVNSVFLYSALKTLPGEQENSSYENGLRYNKTLAEARVQEALGWHAQVNLMPGADHLQLALTARNGDVVGGLNIRGQLGRPASAQFNRALEFREVRPGVYEAAFQKLDAGTWTVDLAVLPATKSGSGTPTYRLRERIWLNPS